MHKFVLGVLFFMIAITVAMVVNIITSSDSGKSGAPDSLKASEKAQKSYPGKELSVAEKKRRFIQRILPVVERVKSELDTEYAEARRLIAKPRRTAAEQAWLQLQLRRYNVSGFPCLLRRMHTHPVSLIVAQAALETGWGTSRFYREANNVFGIWSYNRNEPRLAASERRGSSTIYVRKFASLDDAIRDYFRMIGKGYAYDEFRKARIKSDNPFELLRHLRRYSELRDEYVARLYYVIKTNRLYTYDDPSYAPIALERIIPQYVAMKAEEAARKKALEQQIVALNEVKLESEEAAPPAPCDEENLTLPAPLPAMAAPGRSSRP